MAAIPTDADVLLGREKSCTRNGGNLRLKAILSERRSEYDKAPKILEYGEAGKSKPDINKEIVQEIKASGGRFLKKNKTTGVWEEVSDQAAIDKIVKDFGTLRKKRVPAKRRPAVMATRPLQPPQSVVPPIVEPACTKTSSDGDGVRAKIDLGDGRNTSVRWSQHPTFGVLDSCSTSWACSSCANQNENPRSTLCDVCGSPRLEPGVIVVGSERGLPFDASHASLPNKSNSLNPTAHGKHVGDLKQDLPFTSVSVSECQQQHEHDTQAFNHERSTSSGRLGPTGNYGGPLVISSALSQDANEMPTKAIDTSMQLKSPSTVALSPTELVESLPTLMPQDPQPARADDASSMAVASDDFSNLTMTSSKANDLLLTEEILSMSISQPGRMNTESSSQSSLSGGSTSNQLQAGSREGTSLRTTALHLALPNIFEISTSSSEVTEAIDLKFKQLKENVGSVEVVIETMRELALYTVPTENSSIITSAGGLDESGILILIDVMKRYPGNEQVQAYGCRSLGNLAATGSNNIEVAKRGGIEMIVNAMRLFSGSARLQENGCHVLANLAGNDDNIAAITELGGIGLGIVAMSTFSSNEYLQEKGCLVLGNLASSRHDNKVAIAKQGGIGLVTFAMKAFPCNERLQGRGCLALGNLAAGNERNQITIESHGGIELVVRAMKEFVSNKQVQQYGCLVLGNLARSNEDKAAIAKQDGVRLVINAMKRFSPHEQLQRYGCLALGNLAGNGPVRTEIVKQGGIGLVVQAMESFATNRRLQQKGCFALGVFASEIRNCKLIAGESGVDLIICAMKKFSCDEQLQELGCMALVNLVKEDESAAAMARPDRRELIAEAMHRFSMNEYLQRDGSWLLATASTRSDDYALRW